MSDLNSFPLYFVCYLSPSGAHLFRPFYSLETALAYIDLLSGAGFDYRFYSIDDEV